MYVCIVRCVCVCVCVAASTAHRRSHSRLKPNQGQTSLDFCGAMFSWARYYYVFNVCIQFYIHICASLHLLRCVLTRSIFICGLCFVLFYAPFLITRVGFRARGVTVSDAGDAKGSRSTPHVPPWSI